MGAIQGSINSMLSTSAVAIGGAKHIKEQKASNDIAKAGIAEKSAGLSEELLKLEGEQALQEKQLDLVSRGLTPEGEINLTDSEDTIMKDIEMRKKALSVLKEKTAAKRLLQGAYIKALGGKK